jgi:hypothetical protein
MIASSITLSVFLARKSVLAVSALATTIARFFTFRSLILSVEVIPRCLRRRESFFIGKFFLNIIPQQVSGFVQSVGQA